jgi:hypothetical protein
MQMNSQSSSDPLPDRGVDLGHLLPTMLRRFADGGLRYVVMRNYEGYPHWSFKPDIGLLIDHRDVNRLVGLFHRVCGELGYVFYRGRPGRNNVILMAVRIVEGPDGAARLDPVKVDARTYERFSLTRRHRYFHPFNYKVFLDDTRRRSIEQDGCRFYVYEPLDDLVMLFKQWRRKRIARYRDRIIERLEEAEVRRWFCETVGLESAYPQQLIAPQYDEAVHDDWLWRMAQRRYGRSTLWRMIRTHWRAMVCRLKQTRPRRGPVIYFAGPDGCGKSTVLESVKAELIGGVLGEPVRLRHFYSLKNVLVQITRRFWWLKERSRSGGEGEKRRPIDNMTVRDRDTGRRSWRLRKRLALLVGLIDIRMSYLAAWWFRWRGVVVFVETSPYDVFIKYHMPEFPSLERLAAPLLPRPTICIVLRATPESIIARKAELTLEEIREFYDRLDRVLKRARVGHRVVSVPTDVMQDRTCALATAEVIHQIGLARIGAKPRAWSGDGR